MGFLATINVPGYLPVEDEPHVFETAHEAWQYLMNERMADEDAAEVPGLGYSITVTRLSDRMVDSAADGTSWDGTDTYYGDTPGYDGDHDLGLAYSVTEVED